MSPNNLKFEKIYTLDFTSLGCYYSGNPECSTFEEDGLSTDQCNSAALAFSLSCCPDCCHNIVYGERMTVEICLQICVSNGFQYAALTGLLWKIIFTF